MKVKRFAREGLCALIATVSLAASAAPPKVAVTDLAYEERVSEYFRVVSASEKSSLRASGRESERESDFGYSRRSSGSVNAKSESNYYSSEGTYSYIDRGELRKFTADIKGGILKSGRFQLVQGRPFTDARNNEKLYDIIGRIKKGMYPGADYVLFGAINSIEFRQEANPIDHTNTVSHTLSLELVGEFSLISTRNYTVKSSFSAMGAGQDVKLLTSQGGRVVLNRGKVVAEVSKSLGEDVARQLEEQLGGVYGEDEGRDGRDGRERAFRQRDESPRDEVIIFK
jgi:curli biogenesis system outer membrane secretion channel CsgG